MKQLKNTLTIGILAILTLNSCEKKPTACINLQERLAPKTTLNFSSCSSDYEFLTWDFGDGSNGHISDEIERQYEKEGLYTVTVVAFSDGAYKSDQATDQIIVSERYLKKVEVIGDLNYDKLRFYANGAFITPNIDANGNFTETDPYAFEYVPFDKTISDDGSIKVVPIINDFELSAIVDGSFSLSDSTLTDTNPVIIEEGDYTLKMYWEFKTFQ